jgi:hypothetical protein
LDGTCPGLPLRWRQDGGAGSSPQITVMTGVPAGETAEDYAGGAGCVNKNDAKFFSLSAILLIRNGSFCART